MSRLFHLHKCPKGKFIDIYIEVQVQNPPAMQETQETRIGKIPGGGHGNPLPYSCLENPWTEEPGGLQSMGLQRVGRD